MTMDPDSALDTIRRLAATVTASTEDPDAFELAEAVEAVEALDGFLCRGGPLPADWSHE